MLNVKTHKEVIMMNILSYTRHIGVGHFGHVGPIGHIGISGIGHHGYVGPIAPIGYVGTPYWFAKPYGYGLVAIIF